MAISDTSPKLAGAKLAQLRGLEASLDEHRRLLAKHAPETSPPRSGRVLKFGAYVRTLWRLKVLMPHLKRAGLIFAGVMGVLALAGGVLWWRLASGPIALDLATPWITAAIEQNFGSRHKVEVGGTILERDEHGRTAVRIRDIVVREPDGTVVASAPRAEVGLSHASLLSGQPRAESLSLVGAEISVRIAPDGQFTVLPESSAQSASAGSPAGPSRNAQPAAGGSIAEQPASKTFLREAPKNFAALLAWIDGLRALGLDGYDLNAIGLKNGRVIVDDQRNGQRSVFENISLSLTRPHAGEVVFSIGSEHHERPWLLLAGVKALEGGRRAVSIEARQIALRDVLLAMRIGDKQFDAEIPFSATVRAEIAQDGTPEMAGGRMVIGSGVIGENAGPDARFAIDRAEVTLEWDNARRMLSLPLHVVSGGNRFTLVARAEAPRQTGGPWQLGLSGGSVVLAPVDPGGKPLLLNRVAMRGRFDSARQRIEFDQGDVSGTGVGLAVSGHLDFAGDEPRLAVGIAGKTMTVAAFKQLWPVLVNPPVRAWVMKHLESGSIERVEIATNAPLPTLQPGGPPVPDDGLSIEIVANGAVVTPIEGLPSIRDADFVTRISGRTATIALGRGTVDLPSGRKLTITDGLFEIPDTAQPKPPATARLRIDGQVPAAAELLALDRLRDFSGAPLDPTVSRGAVSAQVGLAMTIDPDAAPGSTTYNVTTDVTNFAVDKFVMSQKIEAQTLRIVANNQGYQIKGDVRIAGTPASVEYRKMREEADAQFRLQSTLDDNARKRLGFDLYGAVAGPIPVKLAGKIAATSDRDSRFSVDADLTQATVDNLLPGWQKPSGKATRATFTYIARPKSTKLEDFVLDGSGTSVKGSIELDADGEVSAANFPVFALSEGDKASIKADRNSDGLLKVVMRGDVIDGRGFIKAAMGGPPRGKKTQGIADLDLDIKLGAIAGFNGEALRALEARMVRREGTIRAFSLGGKLGVDTPLIGDLRGSGGKPVIYFETRDAGSLFRFTDTYARMQGGQMWVAMEPPTLDQAPRDGVLNVRDFSIRGEAALDRVVAGSPGAAPNGVEFTRMRVEFTRQPGKLTMRDGVVRGPVVGATIEGYIDYANNDVRMRGTFVPLYGLNNAFGQIPIVGLFLGGEKEGLLGITYEVVGQPGRSVLRVNPISAVAPGLLRKFFEFPNTTGERNGAAAAERFQDTTR
jgi:hypothetical protein